MIIKISKLISCSSEHPSFPASNLLEHPHKSSWRCAKPNQLIATVILKFEEPSCVTGLEIGNYRSCIIIVEASTSEEPDNWVPIVNHQFLSHDEAANSKFRDQVQIFTKRELNPDNLKIKFDRIKVSCMQSANPRELFGLEFIIFKTEVIVEAGLDVFGRFKLKENNSEVHNFKDKYLKLFGRKTNYKDELKEKIAESGVNNFSKKQEDNRGPKKRPILEKLEADDLSCNSQLESSNIDVNSTDEFQNTDRISKNKVESSADTSCTNMIPTPKKIQKILKKQNNSEYLNESPQKQDSNPINKYKKDFNLKKDQCMLCDAELNKLCKKCHLLPQPKPLIKKEKKNHIEKTKPKKEFNKLFEDISFSLSGYANPHRDEIRRKALKMGAKYVADPNLTNNKCTHLICAFKNTPKYKQLEGHCKIISHKFIEDCFNEKKRIPWRRYALNNKEKNSPESEEEIEGTMSPITVTNIYDQNTDDSDTDY